MVPERARDARAAGADDVRRVEAFGLLDLPAAVARESDPERSRQDQLVGRHPLKTGAGDERNDGVGDRSFRRPQTGRAMAEQPLVAGRRPGQLLRRIVGTHESLPRHPRVGMGSEVDVGVAQERQDRVVERRGRQFDAPCRRQLAVSRNDAIQQFFTTTAFVANQPGRYGNVGRNLLYGPTQVTNDLSLVKSFPISERLGKLQFRSEFFNAWNRVNLGQPVPQLNNRNFGKIQTAGDPRVLQFALRYVF